MLGEERVRREGRLFTWLQYPNSPLVAAKSYTHTAMYDAALQDFLHNV